MVDNASSIVAKLWNYCDVLQDDGGDKVWVGTINTKIEQWNLSAAGDITTATLFDAFTLVGVNTDYHLQPDGTAIYPLRSNGDELKKFSLATPFDLTTAGSVTIGDDLAVEIAGISTNDSVGISFKGDGLRIFVNTVSNVVHQASLTVAWDVNTVVDDLVSYANGHSDLGRGIDITPDGKYLLTSALDDTCRVHELVTPWDLSTASFKAAYDLNSITTNALTVLSGVAIDVYRKKLYAADRAGGLTIFEFDWTGVS